MSSSSDKSYHKLRSSTPLLQIRFSHLLPSCSASTVEAHSSSSTATGPPLNKHAKKKRRKKRQGPATKPRKMKRCRVRIRSDSDWETGSEQPIQEEANSSKSNQGVSILENNVLLKDIRRSKRVRKLSSLRSPSEEARLEQPIHKERNHTKANEGASTLERNVLFKDIYRFPERTQDVPYREDHHHLGSPLILPRRKEPENLDVYNFRSEDIKNTCGSKRIRKRPSFRSLSKKDRPAQPIHEAVNHANADHQGASISENRVQLKYTHHRSKRVRKRPSLRSPSEEDRPEQPTHEEGNRVNANQQDASISEKRVQLKYPHHRSKRVRKLASLEKDRSEQPIHEEGNITKATERASTLEQSVLFQNTYGSPERTRDVPYREDHHHLGSPLILPRRKEPDDLDVPDFRPEALSSEDIPVLLTRVHGDEEDSDEELILSRRNTDRKYKNNGQAYRFKLTFGLKDEDIKKVMSIHDLIPISYPTATANLLWDEFIKKRNTKR